MKLKKINKRILNLIANDDLKTAVIEMKHLYENSNKLDEVVLQSGRLTNLMRQIRSGTIHVDNANVNRSKIRSALLDLLKEVDENASSNKKILKEVEAINFPTIQTNINQSNLGSGDNVGRDKVESHEHYNVNANERVKKNVVLYGTEVFFTFIITAVIAGGLGFAISQAALQINGLFVGIPLAILLGFVAGGSVRRYKLFP